MPARAPQTPRHIWICADDYGLSPGVSTAIRNLIEKRRINATSVMMLAPSLDSDDVNALLALKRANTGIAIGLHFTLTAPFKPSTANFQPVLDGLFPPVEQLLKLSIRRRLDPAAIAAEFSAQLQAFVDAFGMLPDFVDGHQHVHVFPRIGDAVLRTMKEKAPQAWVRQCGRAAPLHRKLRDSKGLLLDILSVAFRRKAARIGVATNPAFAGTYRFDGTADFARHFPVFLDSLPDGGLVMCHPGFVDNELIRLDPLTTLREREYEYFMADGYPRTLAARNILIA